MKSLAIDPGLTTGWAINTNGQIVFGTWNLRGNRFEGAGFRYIRFRNYLLEIVKAEELDYLFYEEVRKHIGTDAAHVYGAIVGVIQSFCEENKIPYKGIPTGTWKKTCLSKGNANKDQVLGYARSKWPQVNTYDEADALCILEHALRKEL